MTNRALQSKKTAIKDSTLIAVIMLGLYENFVFKDWASLKTWSSHGECRRVHDMPSPSRITHAIVMKLTGTSDGSIRTS